MNEPRVTKDKHDDSNVCQIMAHEGFHKDRLKQNNPREVAFSEIWKKQNCKGITGLSTTMNILIPDYTERDVRVAATVIQWLGSNVGMSFLYEVFQKEPKIKEWFGVSQTATMPRKENPQNGGCNATNKN